MTISVLPVIKDQLLSIYNDKLKHGELTSPEYLREVYALFRDRFGPQKLAEMDGEALLNMMHAHGNRDSLVYWLEFKNDDEFPGTNFGSIAGGSAHKFGLFRRKDTGQWVTGSGTKEKVLTVNDAIEIARKHRDQLIAGAQLLEDLPASSDDSAYLALQRKLNEQAPDTSRLAWGHKYFHLLFPEKLDDFHNEKWQRYHLLKLLELPPSEEGLYVCAGRFVELAQEFGWPMNQLTWILNARSGPPVRCWRIGTRVSATESIWPAMRDGGFVAIGWRAVGDLRNLAEDTRRALVQERIEDLYGSDKRVAPRKAGEMVHFLSTIAERDVVVAADGETMLGVGQVKGDYEYDETDPVEAPHRRSVEWHTIESWSLPLPKEGLRTTVAEIKALENRLAIEERLIQPKSSRLIQTSAVTTTPLDGNVARILAILERKGQAILYGPPGTGKTYWAFRTARELAARGSFKRSYEALSPEERTVVDGSGSQAGLVRRSTFHPSYGYEDFIEGYRPKPTDNGLMSFEVLDGIFKLLCDDAAKNPKQRWILVIDEINRGDISRIFGELLTLLEMDKRNLPTILPLSGKAWSVPTNVWIVGTMNTADRSIALLDTALRRRFGFVELMPDLKMLGSASAGGKIPLGPWLKAINERIRTQVGRDARNLQIGHAFLLDDGKPVSDFSKFSRIVAEDIIPLLEEYCYEDYAALARILGPGMVDEKQQRIREELFDPEHQGELVQALLAIEPNMTTEVEASDEDQETDDVREDKAEASG
jgi:5-methylcytosine-specific restriction protein B